MFYSCGNVNSDAAVITVPSSSSGLEAQMFFLMWNNGNQLSTNAANQYPDTLNYTHLMAPGVLFQKA